MHRVGEDKLWIAPCRGYFKVKGHKDHKRLRNMAHLVNDNYHIVLFVTRSHCSIRPYSTRMRGNNSRSARHPVLPGSAPRSGNCVAIYPNIAQDFVLFCADLGGTGIKARNETIEVVSNRADHPLTRQREQSWARLLKQRHSLSDAISCLNSAPSAFGLSFARCCDHRNEPACALHRSRNHRQPSRRNGANGAPANAGCCIGRARSPGCHLERARFRTQRIAASFGRLVWRPL